MWKESARARESRLHELASRQHGAISTTQLHELGFSDSTIFNHTDRGRLHRVHRGVYAVGHSALSLEGRFMAAVLALGPGAAVSHWSAALHWTLISARAPFLPAGVAAGTTVHATVPTRSGRKKRPGIQIHRPDTFSHTDLTLRHRIPVTAPARTLEDLRPALTDQQFNAALRQAEIRRYPVEDVAVAGREPTRSELEHRFMRLCRRHRLPLPEANARVGRYEADFLWRTERLIAELDGYAWHRGRASFELDRRREADLAAAGFEVQRFTWRQVEDDPASVAAALRARLATRDRAA